MNTEITIRIQDAERPAPQPTNLPLVFEGSEIRYAIIGGEPWFVVTDVCKALGITNPSMAIKKLDSDELQIIDSSALNLIEGYNINDLANGMNTSVNVVNESGLYMLMLRSRDAVKTGTKAHRFRKWVTAEVLPTIRKTGKYELSPIQPEKITDEQYAQLFQAIAKVVQGSISGNVRPKLVNYLKCRFNADPLTELKFTDLQPALTWLKSANDQLFSVGVLLRELEDDAVKHVIAGSMPSLRHLKGRYRRELEKKTGRPVSAHEILVHDYVEKNGMQLVEA